MRKVVLITLSLLVFQISKGMAQDLINFTFYDSSRYSGELIHATYKYYVVRGADNVVYEVNRGAISSYNTSAYSYNYKTTPDLNPKFKFRRLLKNEIGINVLSLLSTDLNLYYEYKFTKSKFALRFPLTYGFRSGNFNSILSPVLGDIKFKNIVFGIGLEPRLYSNKYGKNSYTLGLSAEYLLSQSIINYVNYDRVHGIRLMVSNGTSHRVGSNLRLGVDFSAGLTLYPAKLSQYQVLTLLPQFRVRFTIGGLF